MRSLGYYRAGSWLKATRPDLSGCRLPGGPEDFKTLPPAAATGLSLLYSAVIVGCAVGTGLSLICSAVLFYGLLMLPMLEDRNGLSLFCSAVKGLGESATEGFSLFYSAVIPGLLLRLLIRGGLASTRFLEGVILADPQITCLCLSMKSGASVNKSWMSS